MAQVTACGGEEETKRAPFGSSQLPYTGKQVFDLFHNHGLYLMRGGAWDRVVLNSVATQQQRDALTAEYGYFFVSVANEPDAIDTLLSDPTTHQRLEPDARGIYWYREPGIPGVPASWFALRRYGNAIPAWAAGADRRTDERWDRLTAVLDRLPKR